MAASEKPRERTARPKKGDGPATGEQLIDHPLDRILSETAEREAVLRELPSESDSSDARDSDAPDD